MTVYTKADAQARAALIEVDSYEILIAATEATLASGALAGPYHQLLTEQLTNLRRVHTARTGPVG